MTYPRFPHNADRDDAGLHEDLGALGRSTRAALPDLDDTRRVLEERALLKDTGVGLSAALRRRPTLVAATAAGAFFLLAPLSYALVTDPFHLFVDAEREPDELSETLNEQLEAAGYETTFDPGEEPYNFSLDDAKPLVESLAQSDSWLRIYYQEDGEIRPIAVPPEVLEFMLEGSDASAPDDLSSKDFSIDFDLDHPDVTRFSTGELGPEEGLGEEVIRDLDDRLQSAGPDASRAELEAITREVYEDHGVEIAKDEIFVGREPFED